MKDKTSNLQLVTCNFKGRILFDVSMKDYTSFRIGGPADVMAFPVEEDDLMGILQFATARGLPVFTLGAGTNLLVRDRGIRGVVVNLTEGFKGLKWNGDNRVVAGAGVRLMDLAIKCKERGLSGLEFAVGIPGTLGGAVVMNASAYGGEMKDVVDAVEGVTLTGQWASLDKESIGFRYRGCDLPGDVVITNVHMRFKKDTVNGIEQRMKAMRKKRATTQKVTFLNAGCIFKNPEGVSAGRLIEEVGLKGARVGNAQTSRVHANYIVNLGSAKATDVLNLMALIRDKVYQEKGILLEIEVKVVGED
ncbi:MAG: UDP-N-acetylmuramate dehydrogenase [Deltaproteobacteria bacterium]|nr:UDP-N-acetylmuramate dehydrogenase [Deltaproteobacteria bacterium]